MRVLWFTNSPSNYLSDGFGYNGCGWISSLENAIKTKVELGVAFVMNGQESKVEKNGVTYYPVANPYNSSRWSRVDKLVFGYQKETSWLLSSYLKVIQDFRPDVIEVFGSEHIYGLICGYTPVPVLLHIQGLLGECEKAFLPPGMTWNQFYCSDGSFSGYFAKKYYAADFHRRAKVEREILQSVDYFAGRTSWDRNIISSLNPKAKYYHVDEILREPFYELAGKWNAPVRPVIVSTISEAPFKGMDIVLRVARVLKMRGVDFQWKVFGNVNDGFYETFTGIECEDVNVIPMGVGSAYKIADALSCCSVYMHPTYVENSPNSICEAQLIGAPVVATNVGGVPDIVEDGCDGSLFATTEISQMASALTKYIGDENFARSMGERGAAKAAQRHDKVRIVEALMGAYSDIVG